MTGTTGLEPAASAVTGRGPRGVLSASVCKPRITVCRPDIGLLGLRSHLIGLTENRWESFNVRGNAYTRNSETHLLGPRCTGLLLPSLSVHPNNEEPQ